MRHLLFICLLLVFSLKMNGQLIINEVCSFNSEVEDDFGEVKDWVELKNTGVEAINLSSYFLSDNVTDIYKWRLPNLVLYPNEYILVFSEGNYTDDFHFDFGISNSGESIFLSKSLVGIQQELAIPELRVNHSYGKSVFNDSYVYYQELTPNGDNSNQEKLGYSVTPSPNIEGGFFEGTQLISYQNECLNGSVHYTIDGSFPTEDSPVFADNIQLDQISTVKAFCVEDDYLPSYTHTDTYIIDNPYNLPIISLSVSHDSLFDSINGLYMKGPDAEPNWPHFGANYWDKRHIRTSFEYFSNNERQISQDIDLKIHGGKSSRNKPQRPFRLTAREEYGNEFMQYSFFEEKPQEELFKHLILRNSGSDFLKSNFRDGFWHQVALLEELDFDVFGFQPCIVLINGEYWGIMNMRERVSEHFIAQSNEISPDSILIMEKEVTSFRGDTIYFHLFKEFAINEDLSLPENYNVVQDQLDIGSYLDYFCTEIYAGNLDWPANNIKYWKESPHQGKWRYIMFDLDTTMRLFSYLPYDLDMFEFIFGDKSWAVNSKLFISLLRNNEFKARFINRLADLMNTSFTEENLTQHLKYIEDEMSPEIENHFDRWSGDFNRYTDEVNVIIPSFFNVRAGFVKEQIMEHFDMNDMVQLEFDVYPPNSGSININTISPELPFIGDYFNGNPIHVDAVASEGMSFLRWDFTQEILDNSTQSAFTKNFEKSGKLTAVFEDNIEDDFFIVNTIVTDSKVSSVLNSSVTDLFNVSVISPEGKLMQSGREVIEKGKNVTTTFLTNLHSGIYLLKISNSSVSYTSKFMIP